MTAIAIPQRRLSAGQCERMLRTLRAAVDDEPQLAAFLTEIAAGRNGKKRALAQELLEYVLEHRYLVTR